MAVVGEVMDEILVRLRHLDPPVKRFPVQPEDPTMAVQFVELSEVCYITTKTESGRSELLFRTRSGKDYFCNMGLAEVEGRLKEHPHFLRTSKYFLINLTRIRGLKVSSARDLWFDGIEEPILNAVTSTYLSEFEARLSG